MSRIADTREVILTSDSVGEHWSAALWDPQTGSILSTYKQAGALTHRTLQLLSDSYLIGADLTKPRIHIWPLNNPTPVSTLRLTTPGKVTALACTPSGAYMVAAIAEKLFLWQVCNGRLLANLSQHYQTVNCLSFSTDGSIFASGGEDGLVFVWSLYRVINDERSVPLHGFSHHSLPVKDLQFGHLGARGRLCSVSLDRTCNIYDPSGGLLLLTLVFDVPLTSVCMNARESDLFVGCTDGNIYRFNLHEPPRGIEHHVQVRKDGESEGLIAFQGHKSTIVSLSISIDGRYLLSGSNTGEVHIWDIASRQVLRTLDHKGPITAAFFAKYHGNFRATDLEPRLRVSNLQRTSDDFDGKQTAIEVISRDRNAADILNYESYVENGIDSDGAADSHTRKLLEMLGEIERLKKINSDIYQYSVKQVLEKDDKT
ncbi:PREDICTED: WD repeat-containing protein 18 [Dufourea novaeangliae]|uniref:WD repeat-containing protein 18 n=1 Tax=Dufourea novaeangliae TaxID=178035 RepID=A0A154P879_DUFNO|nr:PREDICTED: WD repeat-containing protein 18 [Dufourea novaeangliae]KZC08053.1 WD repeat-containing protein 18 [Dufourea novaeangliae]